jgi:hypothetical protein
MVDRYSINAKVLPTPDRRSVAGMVVIRVVGTRGIPTPNHLLAAMLAQSYPTLGFQPRRSLRGKVLNRTSSWDDSPPR